MAFDEQIMAEIKKRNIEVSDKDLAEFERQNINSDDDVDLGGKVSLSDTTARIHIAALDDFILQEHLRRSLQFTELSFAEQEEISTAIYIASIKHVPKDRILLHLQLSHLYEKKFFKSFRYLLRSQKKKADDATAYMVGSFKRTSDSV